LKEKRPPEALVFEEEEDCDVSAETLAGADARLTDVSGLLEGETVLAAGSGIAGEAGVGRLTDVGMEG
jgi:hypothetical protein